MSMTTFIKLHRTLIDDVIRKEGYRGLLNDQERRQWILNLESLYLWAKAEGVPI